MLNVLQILNWYTEMKIIKFLQNVLTFLEMFLKYVLMEYIQYNMADMDKIIMKSLK